MKQSNYSREDGKTKLIAQGWTNDLNVQRTITRTGAADDKPNAGAMATIAPGMYKLTGKLQQKRWFTFVIRPHLPVFSSGRLLVPGVELKLDLHLNPMSQLLFQTGNLNVAATRKVPIITANDIKVTLILKKVTLNAKIYMDLQKRRTSGKTIVHYPVVRGTFAPFPSLLDRLDGNRTTFFWVVCQMKWCWCLCIPMCTMATWRSTPLLTSDMVFKESVNRSTVRIILTDL